MHSGTRAGRIAILHFVVRILLWAYVAGVCAWLVIRSLVGDRSSFVALVSYLGVWLFFPLLILLPWALRKGWKRSALGLAISGALFVWFYAPLLVPKPGPRQESAAPVTIVTFNVRYLNTDVEALAQTLLGSGADIVALQEVVPYHRARLAPLLATRYPFSHHQPAAGLSVHSRHRIVRGKVLPLEPGAAQSLVIEAGENTFQLINAHLARAGVLTFVTTLDPSFIRAAVAGREAQIRRIQGAIDETGLPAILACDCNMTHVSSGYGQLASTLRDAYRERGWGLGHTLLIPRGIEIPSSVNLAVQRIDYLFHSPEIRATDAQVIHRDSGSDHYPVWAAFDVQRRFNTEGR